MLVGPATARHTATVIFHHGFGATATDWTVLASIYPALSQTKFLFPQAPLRPITIAGGQRIPAWFDILQQSHGKREKDGDEDEVGMREAIRELEKLILKEVEAGIPVERIVIGGFSQGAGLVALQGAIGKVDGLAGICMLSGYVPLSWKVKAMKNLEIPLFWAHGTEDAVIAIDVAKTGVETLKASGMKNVEFHQYPGMGHSYCDEELEDLGAWLLARLPPLEPAAKM